MEKEVRGVFVVVTEDIGDVCDVVADEVVVCSSGGGGLKCP